MARPDQAGAGPGQAVPITNLHVTDVTSPDICCYDSETNSTADTVSVPAGSQLGIMSDGTIVVNVYMAMAPGNASLWAGDGAVWFKFYQISAVTNGGTSISWPAQNLPGVTFTLPRSLPSGQYLVRVESIALHEASTFGGAQVRLEVTGGGSGRPGPLVRIPGVYTGYEPGILINIYYPIPRNYTQPGPALWSG
ncbi:glycoside hydrolase [Gautieria morchelliformis]|nr:glycoside hydrolase [Gautieria morchelliformis]